MVRFLPPIYIILMKGESNMEIIDSEKRTYKITILFKCYLIIFLIGTPLFAAPTVSEVSGTVANGQTVIISGSGFGSGPNVLVFDDFEKGMNGSLIKSGTGSAEVGRWDAVEGSPKYSTANKVSGSLAFRADQSIYGGQNVQKMLPASTTKVFVSWWLLIPSGNVLPGTGNSAGINWKNVWVLGSNTVDDDLVIPTFLGNNSYYINGNNALYKRWITLDFNIGTWKRVWCYLNGGSNNTGQVHYWELTSSGVVQRVNDNNVTVLNSGGLFEKININAYGRQTSNCYPTFDDVYIATGDNARARIEIGNNATYANCTKLTMVTPDSWTSTNITAKVWQGQFTSSDSAFLFVTDSSGSVSYGYPIRFGSASSGSGGSSDTTSPTVPSGLSVQVVQ